MEYLGEVRIDELVVLNVRVLWDTVHLVVTLSPLIRAIFLLNARLLLLSAGGCWCSGGKV